MLRPKQSLYLMIDISIPSQNINRRFLKFFLILKTFPGMYQIFKVIGKTLPATSKTFPATSETFPNSYICTCGQLGPFTKSGYPDKYSKGEVYIWSYYYCFHVFFLKNTALSSLKLPPAIPSPQMPNASICWTSMLDFGNGNPN